MLVFMHRKISEVITGYRSSPSKSHHFLNLRSTGGMSKFLHEHELFKQRFAIIFLDGSFM